MEPRPLPIQLHLCHCVGVAGAGGRALSAAALATYFHFLVGGFWAVAALLRKAFRGMPLRGSRALDAIVGGEVLLVASLCAKSTERSATRIMSRLSSARSFRELDP